MKFEQAVAGLREGSIVRAVSYQDDRMEMFMQDKLNGQPPELIVRMIADGEAKMEGIFMDDLEADWVPEYCISAQFRYVIIGYFNDTSGEFDLVTEEFSSVGQALRGIHDRSYSQLKREHIKSIVCMSDDNAQSLNHDEINEVFDELQRVLAEEKRMFDSQPKKAEESPRESDQY